MQPPVHISLSPVPAAGYECRYSVVPVSSSRHDNRATSYASSPWSTLICFVRKFKKKLERWGVVEFSPQVLYCSSLPFRRLLLLPQLRIVQHRRPGQKQLVHQPPSKRRNDLVSAPHLNATSRPLKTTTMKTKEERSRKEEKIGMVRCVLAAVTTVVVNGNKTL